MRWTTGLRHVPAWQLGADPMWPAPVAPPLIEEQARRDEHLSPFLPRVDSTIDAAVRRLFRETGATAIRDGLTREQVKGLLVDRLGDLDPADQPSANRMLHRLAPWFGGA